jgi:membrane protein implicated in regulation of membrane protease activity
MNNRQRRFVIMALMIIGPVGFLTILGSVLASVGKELFLQELLVIVCVFFVIIQLFKSKVLGKVFHKVVENQIRRRRYFRKVFLEEVLQLDRDHGVCEVKIDHDSKVLNKKLSETDFKDKDFIILAIKRGEAILTAPKGSDEILKNDTLVIFGNIKNIKKSLY